MLLCKYCEKGCKNDNSQRNHERLCKLNPNRQILTSNLVKWQKLRSQGLVKSSNQFVKAKQEGREISISESTKKKISKSRKGKQLTPTILSFP